MATSAASVLAARQWTQAALRKVRLALIALRDARGRFDAASNAGYDSFKALGDAILGASYVPRLQLGVLASVKGLTEAASRKWLERQAVHASAAEAACATMQQMAEAMEIALEDLKELCGSSTVGDGNSIGSDGCRNMIGSAGDESPNRGTAEGFDTDRLPILSTMTMPQICQCVGEVVEMYRAEADAKASVFNAMMGLTSGDLSEKARSDRVTTLLTAWMLNPHLHEEAITEIFEALAEGIACTKA